MFRTWRFAPDLLSPDKCGLGYPLPVCRQVKFSFLYIDKGIRICYSENIK